MTWTGNTCFLIKEIIVVIFDALCLVVQVCREGRLIRRNADTHKLTLKSLHYISSFLPAGLLSWQANRPGSLEWKDLDRRAANTSPLPCPPALVHPRGFTHYHSSSALPCTWGAATLICLNLRERGCLQHHRRCCLCCCCGSIYHDGRLHGLWISGGRCMLTKLLEQNTHPHTPARQHQTSKQMHSTYSQTHIHSDPFMEPVLLTTGLQRWDHDGANRPWKTRAPHREQQPCMFDSLMKIMEKTGCG